MVVTCLRCHLDFVTQKPARGPVATVCSRRACRRGKPKRATPECLVCRGPMPDQGSGQLRLFCTVDCREVARFNREWQDSFITERDERRLESVGYLPGSWHREAPPKRARLVKRPSGAGDLDPEFFRGDDGSLPDWLTEFLKDFKAAGPDVGQTYLSAGLTLGTLR